MPFYQVYVPIASCQGKMKRIYVWAFDATKYGDSFANKRPERVAYSVNIDSGKTNAP